MGMKKYISKLIVIVVLVTVGCEAPHLEGKLDVSEVSEVSLCIEAAEHVRQCLGMEVAPQDSCDEGHAEAILGQTCEDMNRMASNPKADGGWFSWMHCKLGVLHFCEVPVCEEDSNPLLPLNCVFALGSQGCAQCDYYQCLEEEMQCGPKGYLQGFVGKYCERFSAITYPRMSAKGKLWMEEVRECLIYRLDSGHTPDETCSELKKRGIADHKVCYLDAGICELPLGDWLGITATLSPLEFPIFQAASVGIPCLKSWFGWK